MYNITNEITDEELARCEKSLEETRRNNKIIDEIAEIEKWFTQYDRVCNEHARCKRMGIECHHDIEEWDNLAVEKAEMLKDLRKELI